MSTTSCCNATTAYLSYNLAVVIDDALQGVTQVVRGDDLLDSTPRQIHLQRLLGLPTPEYGHVAARRSVSDGERLSKRHGSVSLGDLTADGASIPAVVTVLLRSCGVEDPPDDASSGLEAITERFDLGGVTRDVVVFESAADHQRRRSHLETSEEFARI